MEPKFQGPSQTGPTKESNRQVPAGWQTVKEFMAFIGEKPSNNKPIINLLKKIVAKLPNPDANTGIFRVKSNIDAQCFSPEVCNLAAEHLKAYPLMPKSFNTVKGFAFSFWGPKIQAAVPAILENLKSKGLVSGRMFTGMEGDLQEGFPVEAREEIKKFISEHSKKIEKK